MVGPRPQMELPEPISELAASGLYNVRIQEEGYPTMLPEQKDGIHWRFYDPSDFLGNSKENG